MKYRITSRFLEQESFRSSPHFGIDFAMKSGEELKAVQDGVIRIADYGNKLSGKTVFIDTIDGKTLIYGHLSDFTVKNGDIVSAGDLIGLSGNTGHSTGAHLHFAIKENGSFVDPSSYIDLIQNMNTPNFFSTVVVRDEIINQSFNFLDVFKDHASIFNDLFQSLKFQLVYMCNLIDYSMLMQHIQNLLQFFS